MSDESSMPYAGKAFNIIKHRGDPTTAMTLSGHPVKKEEFVYIKVPTPIGNYEAGDWMMVKCADYHNEHFVYLDPLFFVDGPEGKGHWFAMCTCGAPAVIINPKDVGLTHDSDADSNMLVCQAYMMSVTQFGVGRHATGDGRRWW